MKHVGAEQFRREREVRAFYEAHEERNRKIREADAEEKRQARQRAEGIKKQNPAAIAKAADEARRKFRR